MSNSVRVRFAPSPTGPLHIGGVRTALFNWLFARHHGGQFILRIEDTDQKRYAEGSLELITEGLRWLGLDWDEGPEQGGDYGPYIQSERLPLYQQWAQWLVDHGKAYRCYCTPERLDRVREIAQKGGRRMQGYDRHCRNLSEDERAQLHTERNGEFVVRFAMPLVGQTVVHDLIRGDIIFDNKELNDLVLLKSDSFPTYHLANVVDDHTMAISHIMRAEEWISSAPIHHQLYAAFGWQMPLIAHLPLILNPSGQGKLSKRAARFQEGNTSVPILLHEFREEGYVPAAILNFLANTGWHIGDNQEVFTMDEAIANFDLSGMGASGTAFNIDKLQWLNGIHIRTMDTADLTARLQPILVQAGYAVDEAKLAAITPHIQGRLKTLNDAIELTAFLWQTDFIPADSAELIPNKLDLPTTQEALRMAYERLAALPDFDHSTQEAAMRQLADELDIKAGQLFTAIRMAVLAQKVSPPLFESLAVLGRETTLARLQQAIDSLALAH